MAAGALSIKLRCASWQQLSTIYRRDLSRGAMFLKASTPPTVGTEVRIDLTLPSDTVITLTGVVEKHVVDPARGSGVELRLAPIPESSVWLIESALASESKVRAKTDAVGGAVPVSTTPQQTGVIGSLTDGEDVALAERELVAALGSEVESLKKLNPFLVLGVGYEAADADVRAAFGELTKRYHPDRFARYQSTDLRQTAAEIFILIRDAYRKIGDEVSRAQVLQQLGRTPSPRAVPNPRATPPPVPRPPIKRPPTADPSAPPVARTGPVATIPSHQPERPTPNPTVPLPNSQSQPVPSIREQPGPPARPTPKPQMPPEQRPVPNLQTERRPVLASPPPLDSLDPSQLDDMLDSGRIDDALAAFKVLSKKQPTDRTFRAGIELCEGLRSLAQRDRLEAAQRFEAALEIDPSNERAARELAEMRRQATNERKGLLSRLMGKKE